MTRAGTVILAVVMSSGVANAEDVVVLGDAPTLVEALRRQGHQVIDADAARARVTAALVAAQKPDPAALVADGHDMLYERADFAAAIGSLTQAIDVLLPTTRTHEGAAAVARLQLDLAVAYRARGARDAAEMAAELAVRLDPELQIDPARHAPDVRELLDRARARRPAERVQAIATVPAGAELTIDGVARGPSPLSIALAEGPHAIVAESAGGGLGSRRYEVSRSSGTVTVSTAAVTADELAAAALCVGDVASGAVAVRDALGADRAIGVRTRDAGVEARVIGSGTDARLQAQGEPELARMLASGPDLRASVGPSAASTQEAPPEAVRDAREESGGGSAWWLWAGAGVLVTAGIFVTVALLLPEDDDPRVVVFEPQQ